MALRSICDSLAGMSAMRFIVNTCRAWSGIHLYLGVGLGFAYYSLLITHGAFDFFHDVPRTLVSGVVFNSMLSHLLQGDFAVDPDAIRLEAFLKDGKTYTYFGIAPAFLRLPLLPFKNFATIDVVPENVSALVLSAPPRQEPSRSGAESMRVICCRSDTDVSVRVATPPRP